jgi:glycosyltransferase involved in cell wall biosynthesis
MRKALHVINGLSAIEGGTSVSVPALAVATSKTHRYSATLLHAHGNYSLSDYETEVSAKSTDFSAPSILSNLMSGGEIDRLVQEADVVHIHGIWQQHSIGVGLIAARRKKPLVFSAHGMLERWALRNKRWKKAPYSLFVERPNLGRAALLRALTRAEADDYRRYGLHSPIAVIPNGVDQLEPASTDLTFQSWPELRGRRIVLYLSRIHYKKGVDLLAKAWSVIAPAFPDSHLVYAGPDSEGTQSTVEQIIKDSRLKDRVTFTGSVFGERKASLLRAASIFILPSYSEGFSIATLEALSVGLPVIITRECHFQEVEERGAGWCISPTMGDIAEALKCALSETSADLQSRGKRGQDLAGKYCWEEIGRQMADAFDWVLGGPRPTSMEIVD